MLKVAALLYALFTISLQVNAYPIQPLKTALDNFLDQIYIPKDCQLGIDLSLQDETGHTLDSAKLHSSKLIYTASISKLLILLAVAHEVNLGHFTFSDPVIKVNNQEKIAKTETVKSVLRKMIYASSNYHAGVSQRLLSYDGMSGKKRTGEIITEHGFGKGIFWVGKGYKNGGSFPGASGYNHEGTPEAITTFYKKLLFNNFFSNGQNAHANHYMMKSILTESKFINRFYGALLKKGFKSQDLLRKSGSWSGNGSYSDSIAINLSNNHSLIMTLLTQGKSCLRHGSKDWHRLLINKVFL